MGTYIPAGPSRKRSVSDTLLEAEEEHFLDCPDADFFIRLAAVLLDAIFLFLIHSALQRITKVANGYFTADAVSLSAPLTSTAEAFSYLMAVAKVSIVYFYFFWSVTTFGGTPGKLLLGLKILRADNGQRLSMGRVLLREVFGKGASLATLGLGFVFPLARRDRRALHDLVSGSVVKRIHGDS